jgi:predicted Zn-dependent protease with MMP-like domain
LDIDGFSIALDEAAEQIPEELLRGLNGGIIVLPDIKMHPNDPQRNLYIMGEYHVQIPGLGRYIVLYYGSFERIFGVATPNDNATLREEIRKTLIHELRHHIESLSGVRDLEYEDELKLESYYLRHKYNEIEGAATKRAE